MTADGGERSLGAPRFDVVLRGYDRRQVDEHVARLQRVLGRMRADLDAARSNPFPAVRPPGMGPGPMGPPPGPPPGARPPRPTPRPRPGGPDQPDVIGPFTDRMQSILQKAEEEAAEIRASAHRDARAETDAAHREHDNVTRELAELSRQREAVLAELTRLRGQLEGMLGAPTARFAATPPRDQAEEGRGARPSPRPKPDGGQPVPPPADETTAMRRPDAGELFRPQGEDEPATAMVPVPPRSAAEPDHTVAVSAVQRSGDTGSAEKSGPADEHGHQDTPSDAPGPNPDPHGPGPTDEVNSTVRVSAVRPNDGRGNGRNGRSGGSDEARGGDARPERNGSTGNGEGPANGRGSDGSGRPDRSTSGSRAG